MFLQVNLVLNLDPAERNRKSMMNYLTEYIREVPLNSKAKQAMARTYAFHLQVCLLLVNSMITSTRESLLWCLGVCVPANQQ